MIDNVYIDDLRVVVTQVKGLGSPNPRQDVTPKAARHGAIDRTLYYEGRIVDLTGVIVGTNELDAWTKFDAIKGKLQLGAARTLRLRRTGLPFDEFLMTTVAGPVDDAVSYEVRSVIRWGVSLHAPDPRLYVAALSSASYDPTAALSGGGATMPLTLPLSFATTASTLQVTNGGNTPTPPVFTIQGPAVNPIVDNVTTGQSIGLIYALGSSDVIEVDVAARTVKLNGALRYDLLDAPNTAWWELGAGVTNLRLRGTGMAVGQTLLTCSFRDARI